MSLLEKADNQIIEIANPIWANLVKSSNMKDYGGFTKDFSSQMLYGANEVELGKQWASNDLISTLSEKYRFYNKERTYFHASQYILPWSLSWAKHNGYDFLFVSLQSDLQRKRIARILTNDANKYTNVEWTLLDKLYNTCNNNQDKPQCWQHIVRHTINEGSTWNLISQQN